MKTETKLQIKKKLKNKTLKVTISNKGYSIWKLIGIVNMIEEYELVKENLPSLDSLIEYIPDGYHIDMYLGNGDSKVGRYR